MGRARHRLASSQRSVAVVLLATTLACGPATGTDAPGGSSHAVVQIVNYAFVPQRLTVTPGTAVLFLNLDGFQHAVASEAVAGSHVAAPVNGTSFETPPFTGTWTLTVPATTPAGTVIPYFCWLHPSASLGDGAIEVVAP